jgi:import inner membrane translocase subunit TIM22
MNFPGTGGSSAAGMTGFGGLGGGNTAGMNEQEQAMVKMVCICWPRDVYCLL